MIYLLLCILSSTGIFIIFKILDRKAIPSFPAIIINYLFASVLGFLVNSDSFSFKDIPSASWLSIAAPIGFLFIIMFFVVAISSREAGLSITTVAGKMSVVFPIAFSIILGPEDQLNLIKSIAILATLIGVLLTVYKPGAEMINKKGFYIPLLLFIGMGLVDSLVKYAQHAYVNNQETAIFSAALFTMAFLTGMFILPFRKEGFTEFRRKSVWLWGSLLGVVNFGSIFFMVRALNFINPVGKQIDSSIIFGANNIGIVSLSVLASQLFFKEKLSTINWAGIGISLVAIILFSFS